jgi:hypothetical protein
MSARAVVVARAEPTPSVILSSMLNDTKNHPEGRNVTNLQKLKRNNAIVSQY